MPPRRSVAAINASVEAPKEVADACETTIRDEFQHVAIRPNGVEMDGKHMDNGKSIPLEGAAAALRRTPARTRSRTQEEGGGGMGAHTPCRARALSLGRAFYSRADIEMLGHLGSGISSVVRRARHKRTRELYAVKLINVNDPDKRSMLMKEVKMLCLFDCDALVQFHGAYPRARALSSRGCS